MPRNITVTFADGSTHVYQNAPDNVTPDQVSQRAQKEFGKPVKALDGGRGNSPASRPVQAAKPQPKPSFLNSMLDSAKAIGGTAMRAASFIPDTAADIGDAVTGGIDAVAHGRMPWEIAQSNKPKFRLADVPDKLGTPRPYAPGVEFAGNALFGAIIPGPKIPPTAQVTQRTQGAITATAKAAAKPAATRTAAQQIVKAGEQHGIPVLTSDVKPPRTFVGKIAQATGERVLGMGTGSVRQAQNAKRIAAVENFVAEHGNPDLIDNVQAVASDLVATRGKQLQTLTAAKNSAIKGVQGNVPVDRTLTKIDEQISWLRGINESAYAPVIAKLEQFKANLATGKTLEQIEGNRKLLGDLFADPSLAAIKSDGQKALNAIYAPLRAEMGTYIRNKGGAAAFAKWQNANQRLAALAGELDAKAFKNVLGATDTTPEKVASLIFNKSPSEVQRLAANLSPAGRTRAQAAIVAKAAEGATNNGVISPQKFANAMQAMDRNVGVFFDATDKARIDGFTRLLKATQRASEAAAAPPTGVQTAMTALYGGAGATAGIPGLVGIQSYGVMARIYESAPVRNMLIGLSKTKPGSKAETAILQRLAVPIAAIIEREGPNIMNAANDRTAMSAAASNETSGKNQQQQQPLPQ